MWRDRFWRICEKQSSRNFSISSLSLHWSWVVQHTLNTVPVAFGVLDYRFVQPPDLECIWCKIMAACCNKRPVSLLPRTSPTRLLFGSSHSVISPKQLLITEMHALFFVFSKQPITFNEIDLDE